MSRSDELYSRYGLKPRIVAVFDSKGSAHDSTGLNLQKLVDVKKKSGSVKEYDKSKSQTKGIEIINSILLGAKEKFNLLRYLDQMEFNGGTAIIQSDIDHVHKFTPSYSSGEYNFTGIRGGDFFGYFHCLCYRIAAAFTSSKWYGAK